jgi:hypothetical protein
MQNSLMFGRERNGRWVSPRPPSHPHTRIVPVLAILVETKSVFAILLACWRRNLIYGPINHAHVHLLKHIDFDNDFMPEREILRTTFAETFRVCREVDPDPIDAGTQP